jgi:hypothetical protein
VLQAGVLSPTAHQLYTTMHRQGHIALVHASNPCGRHTFAQACGRCSWRKWAPCCNATYPTCARAACIHVHTGLGLDCSTSRPSSPLNLLRLRYRLEKREQEHCSEDAVGHWLRGIHAVFSHLSQQVIKDLEWVLFMLGLNGVANVPPAGCSIGCAQVGEVGCSYSGGHAAYGMWRTRSG